LALILEVSNAVYLINEPHNYLHIPLHNAAEHGNLKQVSMLLDPGSIIISTVDGYTPLHFAFNCYKWPLYSCEASSCIDNGVPVTHNAQQASFLDIALFKESSVALVAVNYSRWQECLDLVSPRVHNRALLWTLGLT